MERHFYGLLPDQRLSELTDGLRARFYPAGIAKHPPHITIVPPFETDRSDELWQKVVAIAQKFHRFQLKLNGLGVFADERKILHLRTETDSSLPEFRRELLELTGVKVERDGFNPHLTVGKFEDKELQRVQEELVGQSFDQSFFGERLVDFKDEGGRWRIVRELQLSA